MAHPLRIWIFSNEFEPYIIGGLGTAVTNLTKAYVHNGIECTVVCHAQQTHYKQTKAPNLQIYRLPQNNTYFSHRSKQYKLSVLSRWLDRLDKPDGIHIHSPQYLFLARYYQKKHHIPVIYTCHSLVALEEGAYIHKKQALYVQKKLLQLADVVVVPSNWELHLLKRLYPFCRKKTVVIPHGVKMYSTIDRGPRNHLLFIGRIVPAKGIDHLLKALALLKKEGFKAKLDLVGTGPQGYLNDLKYLAKRLGIEHEVRWLGYRTHKQIQAIYTSNGALVMPSHHESFGLVALESLASGIPLVSTRSGGLSDFVNSRVAQTIPKATGTAIAAAIMKMWTNKNLTKQRVIAGRRLASQYYWPDVAKRYQRIFRKRG